MQGEKVVKKTEVKEMAANKYAGTQTEKNLQEAFAGESQARNKYTFFASVAKKEGYEQMSALFLKTADNEKEHAKMWFKELAGIGDTLFHVIPSTIIGSLASYMALEGNPMALILWIAFGFLRLGFMRSFFKMRYREGAKVVGELGNKLKKITKAANVLGITVIGALIPSVVNAKFAYTFTQGEVSIAVQELADKIMPSLAPCLVVLLTYWLLGRKKMNSTRVTLLLVVLGILAFNLMIFA